MWRAVTVAEFLEQRGAAARLLDQLAVRPRIVAEAETDSVTVGQATQELARRHSGSSRGSVRVLEKILTETLRQARVRAEELVEDEDASHETVQVVFVGEADAGEHLLAVTGDGTSAAPRGRLCHRGRHRREVEPRGVEDGGRGLERDERLRQAVADGLEAGDRLAELDALECVLASQRQHLARCPDELVRHRELSERDRAGSSGRAAGRRRRPRPAPRPGRATGRRRAPAARRAPTCRPLPRRARSPAAAITSVDGRTAVARPRTATRSCWRSPGASHDPTAGSATDVEPSSSRPIANATTWSSADDVAPDSPCSSNRRDTAARVSNDRASCQPSSVDRGVERVAGVLLGGGAQAALEQLEVFAFDHRSFPRSSRRRAMMLRWISALPP